MNTNTNRIKQWQEQEALSRFQLIAPLLQEDLDDAKRLQLRKEVPERSVAQIICILELEGYAAPGVLKRSTLERHLYRAGYGKGTDADVPRCTGKFFQTFLQTAPYDAGTGGISSTAPKLPIGEKWVPEYRRIFPLQLMTIPAYCWLPVSMTARRKPLLRIRSARRFLRYGKFDACYFDNGSQYIARQIRLSLSRLGIRVLHAKPRSGKSKGKIEKFHQVVDMFNREAKLKNIKTLEELNRLWAVFLDAYYHQKPHEGISEYYESLGAAVPESGITPLQEWNRDSRPLTYLDVSVVSEAFLHHETRKVDKGACISFRGRKYETKPALIGYKVEISYDPAAPETITVSYPGYEPFTTQPVRIGEFCDKNPTLPAAMQEQTPTTSRFLDALEKKHSESTRQMADAISLCFLSEGGG